MREQHRGAQHEREYDGPARQIHRRGEGGLERVARRVRSEHERDGTEAPREASDHAARAGAPIEHERGSAEGERGDEEGPEDRVRRERQRRLPTLARSFEQDRERARRSILPSHRGERAQRTCARRSAAPTRSRRSPPGAPTPLRATTPESPALSGSRSPRRRPPRRSGCSLDDAAAS